MRYLNRLLDRIRTTYLVTFVAVADLALFFGIVPFELYCRSAILAHRGDIPFLLALLAANAVLILFLLAAMAACSVVLARGARRAVKVTLPARRRFGLFPDRSRRFGR